MGYRPAFANRPGTLAPNHRPRTPPFREGVGLGCKRRHAEESEWRLAGNLRQQCFHGPLWTHHLSNHLVSPHIWVGRFPHALVATWSRMRVRMHAWIDALALVL